MSMDETLVCLILRSCRDECDDVRDNAEDDLSDYARSELTQAYRHIDNALADIEDTCRYTADQSDHPWDAFTDGAGPERL